MHPTELAHPGMVNGEGVVEKDDVGQLASVAQPEQLGEHVVVGAPTAVFGRAFIQLVVHARGAVGTRERASALGGHVDHAGHLVEHIAGHERQIVDGLERLPERRSLTALDPDIGDGLAQAAGLRGVARLESLDQIEHGGLALAQAHIVEAGIAQHHLRGKGRMQTAGDDRNVALRAQRSDQSPPALPLPGGERESDEARRRGPNGGDDVLRVVVERRSQELDLVTVLAQVGTYEGRTDGGHGPRPLGIDFDEQDLHASIVVQVGRIRQRRVVRRSTCRRLRAPRAGRREVCFCHGTIPATNRVAIRSAIGSLGPGSGLGVCRASGLDSARQPGPGCAVGR